jgi:hypothetical protein
MYFNPLLLITNDFDHNKKIGNLVYNNYEQFNQQKIKCFETLPDSTIQKKSLYDLLFIESILVKIYHDCSLCDFNVLNSSIQQIDNWRLREKIKKILAHTRSQFVNTIHSFDSSQHLKLVTNDTNWDIDEHKTPHEWNGVLLDKIFIFVTHIYTFIEILEIDLLSSKNNEMFYLIPIVIESTKNIHKDVKDYIRLVNSI